MVDYDLDNDGLIEVSNVDQWRSIQDDPNGDGIVANTSAHWNTTGYPNAMTAAGCPPRDHDGNTATPDKASCIGYELIADISPGGNQIGGTYTAKLVGNGFRILNPTGSGQSWAPIRTLGRTGTVEGIGVVNPQATGTSSRKGGLVSELQGSAIGVYVEGGSFGGSNTGGIAGVVTNSQTSGAGLVAHSYVRGTTVGHNSRFFVGGLAGDWGSANTGASSATCVNSYFSGSVIRNRFGGLIGGQNRFSRGTFLNCVGDTTTDTDDSALGTNDVSGLTATKAQMTAVTGYDTPATNNPFANWDDYAADGTALDSMAPRTDFWYFGDSTTFPVLKAWGHDYTMAMTRSLTGTDTVNLCSRTLAVANEIIRLLKDDTFADGVTAPVPADITSLSDCTASTDTQSVSINNLRDYAATTQANPLNLSPGRSDPALARLTSLDLNDFAYLPNAAHFNLSGNSLATLPPRLFQGIPLRWLDLSDNQLTTLPADLFAGIGAVSETTGNLLLLNGNSLTDTGIPGRLFDTMAHLNGLDLSDNALTRINTRWFKELANLGGRPASNAFAGKVGLHLSYNTISEHYHSENLFSGVRTQIVPYTGATAGGTLKTAIVAAITAAAGGTTPTTLDLDTTDHYVASGGTVGYQAPGITCPTGLTVGPYGAAYLGDIEPECYVLPYWTPPYLATVTATVPSDAVLALSMDKLTVTLTHASSSTFVAYQLRQRLLPSDPDDDWTGAWSTVAMTLASGEKSIEAGDGVAGTGYQVQLRILTEIGPSTPRILLLAPDLEAPTQFEIVEESGTLVLRWDAPTGFSVDHYEYRTRQSGTTEWSDWTSVDHVGALGSRQMHRLTNIASGTTLQVELRYIASSATSPVSGVSGAIRVSIPEVDSIKPVVREVAIQAGESILLSVDVYNAQQALDNGIATSADSQLVFRWSEQGSGGGTFADPANTRRVTYTAPSSPGTYRVTAEAQPDGICLSHHEGASEITAADRAPCIATFTISVSRAPADATPRPDPVNPTGVIPTSMTDDAGTAYTVFTPVDGGTFTGDNLTVSADAGIVPNRTLLGVTAAVSALPPPIPIPGASMSVAGNYYDINAIQQSGQPPLTAYSLNDPLMACLPFPVEFRADLSNIVAVQRAADGGLGILTTKVRANAGDLTVCGAVSTLPATVAVAKLGTVSAPPATPAPEQSLPEAGATAPNGIMVVLMLLAGALLLTGISRIYRMRAG